MQSGIKIDTITCPICSIERDVFIFDKKIFQWCKCAKHKAYLERKVIDNKNNIFLVKDHLFLDGSRWIANKLFVKRFFDINLGIIEIIGQEPIRFKLDLTVDYGNLKYIYSKLEKIKLLL